MPAQNNLAPPPEPVLSMTGVLNFVVLPKFSATAVANGNTVEEPTIRIFEFLKKIQIGKISKLSNRKLCFL